MNHSDHKPAILALADGTVVHGEAVGAQGTTGGELCFNTSMTGYQEIFTDPSYHSQLMMMTYPHIGNYGASGRDDEASSVMISGLITRAFSHTYSNPQADSSLQHYLQQNNVVGISGVDTRRLVRHIRENGVMNAVISSTGTDERALVRKAQQWPSMAGLELASKVSIQQPAEHGAGGTFRIAALDYGMKRSIVTAFNDRRCTVRIFPATTDFKQIMEWNPDGFFFSNGPGDPEPMDYAVETVRKAIDTGRPIFGICLGHQLMARAEGLKTEKMFVGHRGANHPVKNLETGRVEITTQNHGFAVSSQSVDPDIAEVTHVNLNDDTIEGLEFKRFNGFGVQYHPEASPGPHDSRYLFDRFIERLEAERKKSTEVAATS